MTTKKRASKATARPRAAKKTASSSGTGKGAPATTPRTPAQRRADEPSVFFADRGPSSASFAVPGHFPPGTPVTGSHFTQPCQGTYRAQHSGSAIVLSAQGTHPTAGFSAFFVNSPVSPFEFALVHQAPTGPAAPTVTPFSTSIVFPAAGSPATVTVHDALGTHFVPVEQMGPSFAVASPLAHAAFAAPHLTAAAATATAQGTPLVPIEIPSIYRVHGQRVNLPARLAKCTPDTYVALGQIGSALEAAGGKLYLSDLYRSYDDQWQAHQDYVTGRKPAYSPPPGGSMHEAGRAFDLDLDALAISLAEFWEIARAHGVYPIIRTPNSSTSEAWHFDRRGSHGRVYDYYSSGQATNMKPYTAMAVSSILANGERVDRFSTNRAAAAIQCALLRLGFNPGRIDGSVGQRTRGALAEANVPLGTPDEMLARLDGLLRLEFPEEFAILPEEPGEPDAPEHLIP